MKAPQYLFSILLLVLTLTVNADPSMPEVSALDSTNDNSPNSTIIREDPLTFEQISKQYIENPKTVGEARLKVLFWKIYDAKLSATAGVWNRDTPFALSLNYLRDFEGEEIARRSVDEMREIGYDDQKLLNKWFEQMRDIFPNVKEGENITGVLDKNQHSHFYHQGKLIGSIEDKLFGESFFGIWLHEKTSEPKMRKQLLGLK